MKATPLILFFSRGRGHGHAIPDMAIAAELLALRPDVRIQFVSYATGAATLEKGGWDVLDLDLPENNGFLPTLYRAQSLISCLKPALVVAHEEFAALAAAKIAGARSIFISAWLPPPGSLHAECLADAGEVIVLGEPGIFPLSHPRMPSPHFVGDVLRRMTYKPADRARARSELSVRESATVIMAAAGGWATEAKAPIAEVVLAAFRSLPVASKVLFWLAGKDHEEVRQISRATPEVQVFEFCDPIERWMVASDVLVTKGTRGLTLEAARLGLPSISLSAGMNPADDILVPRISTNLALNANAVDSSVLRRYIELQIERGAGRPLLTRDGLAATVALIRQYVAGV